MPTFWFDADGKVIVDGDGKPIDCADCACGCECSCGDLLSGLYLTVDEELFQNFTPCGDAGDPNLMQIPGAECSGGVCVWSTYCEWFGNLDGSACLEWVQIIFTLESDGDWSLDIQGQSGCLGTFYSYYRTGSMGAECTPIAIDETVDFGDSSTRLVFNFPA